MVTFHGQFSAQRVQIESEFHHLLTRARGCRLRNSGLKAGSTGDNSLGASPACATSFRVNIPPVYNFIKEKESATEESLNSTARKFPRAP